jgi:hypothetical protein
MVVTQALMPRQGPVDGAAAGNRGTVAVCCYRIALPVQGPLRGQLKEKKFFIPSSFFPSFTSSAFLTSR